MIRTVTYEKPKTSAMLRELVLRLFAQERMAPSTIDRALELPAGKASLIVVEAWAQDKHALYDWEEQGA